MKSEKKKHVEEYVQYATKLRRNSIDKKQSLRFTEIYAFTGMHFSAQKNSRYIVASGFFDHRRNKARTSAEKGVS